MAPLAQVKVFGHPVHVMLVHFPIALFPAGLLFDITGMLLGEPRLFAASFYALALGMIVGLPAGLFGFLDYVRLGNRPAAFRTAGWHAAIQFLVLTTFGIITGLKLQAYPDYGPPDRLQLLIMGMAVAALFVGNYLGGELILKHRVGMIDEDG